MLHHHPIQQLLWSKGRFYDLDMIVEGIQLQKSIFHMNTLCTWMMTMTLDLPYVILDPFQN
jgi:hypothetical protein